MAERAAWADHVAAPGEIEVSGPRGGADQM
jgi:hypothetical protein